MRREALLISLVVGLLVAGTAQGQTVYRFDSVKGAVQASAEGNSLFYPSGVAVDPNGSIWIADTANHVIRVLTPAGGFRVIAGVPGVDGSRDGDRTEATFSYPQGLAFDLAGNLYIADSGNGVIRRLRPDGIVETWAGSAEEQETRDGDRLDARFVTPIDLAWDLTGELWVSDYSAHVIRRIGSDGVVSTVAGEPGTPGYEDGYADHARFHRPAGIDLDAQGRLWVVDEGNGLIRAITRDGFADTIAGTPGLHSHRDGELDEAGFDHPADIAIDDAGNAYVTDSWSHTIRMITGTDVTTIAGTPGQPGYRDGKGPAARFDHPVAIAIAPDGSIYVTDMLNNAVREGHEDDFRADRRRSIRR